MSLERGSVALSWCLLTLAVPPGLLAVVYWVSLLLVLWLPEYRGSSGQGGWFLMVSLAMLLVGATLATGWKIMSGLRRAVRDRESPAVSVWLGSLGYHLVLLALSLLLPWPFGWHQDDVSLLLVFLW